MGVREEIPVRNFILSILCIHVQFGTSLDGLGWLIFGAATCSCSGFGRRKRRVCNDSDFVILYDLTI